MALFKFLKDRTTVEVAAATFHPAFVSPTEDGLVSTVVERQAAIPEVRRTGSKYIHVSGLVNFCGRAHVLAARDDSGPSHKWAGAANRILWAMGRAAEAEIVDTLLAATKREGIFAKWVCRCGSSSYEGVYRRDQPTCARCRRKPFVHSQVGLINHEFRIVGSPDLVLEEGHSLRVVEVKSVTKSRLEELNAPTADHLLQAILYRELLFRAGFPVIDEVNVLYVSRDFVSRNSPFKEYKVSATARGMDRLVPHLLAKAKEASDAVYDDNAPLPERLCQHPQESRARACPHAVDCFERFRT